jgi:hypothetical protein
MLMKVEHLKQKFNISRPCDIRMSKHNLCYIYKGENVQANLNVTVYTAEIYKCYVNVYVGGLIFEFSC